MQKKLYVATFVRHLQTMKPVYFHVNKNMLFKARLRFVKFFLYAYLASTQKMHLDKKTAGTYASKPLERRI